MNTYKITALVNGQVIGFVVEGCDNEIDAQHKLILEWQKSFQIQTITLIESNNG